MEHFESKEGETLSVLCGPLLLISVSLVAFTYASVLEEVVRWQAEGLEAWNTYAVSTWQAWWTYNPYELAAYCWNSFSSWLQVTAAIASIYGLWRNR